jgi:hypothetical protein
VVVAAERTDSVAVVTLDMEEEAEGAADMRIGDQVVVYHQANGEEEKHHRNESLALGEDEGEVTEVIGVVEAGADGNRKACCIARRNIKILRAAKRRRCVHPFKACASRLRDGR